MGRTAKLEPKWDKSRQRWYVSVPERLSHSGKRFRKFFAEKEEARSYSKRTRSLEQQNSRLIRKASSEVIEAAVHFNELFQLYGFSGLSDACRNLEERLKKRVTLAQIRCSLSKL